MSGGGWKEVVDGVGEKGRKGGRERIRVTYQDYRL